MTMNPQCSPKDIWTNVNVNSENLKVNYCYRNIGNPESLGQVTKPIQAIVYQCQSGKKHCNPDAMVEVWKSVYDCFKKKNCDNCSCVICGPIPGLNKARLEKGRAKEKEKKKSQAKRDKEAKTIKADIAKAEAAIKGKKHEEKEIILRDLAKAGKPLPDGRTPSEKKLIKQLKANMGLKRGLCQRCTVL